MKPKPMDLEIERVIEFLNELDPSNEDYSTAVNNLKVLCEAKNKNSIWLITIAPIVGQAIVTLLVLNYEKFHIITTRSSQFWRKV